MDLQRKVKQMQACFRLKHDCLAGYSESRDKWKNLLVGLCMCMSSLVPLKNRAESGNRDSLVPGNYRKKCEIATEYLIPTKYSNQIETVSAHAFFWKKYFKTNSVLISVGLSGTYAWGYSRQWYRRKDSTFLAVDYKTSGLGIGPVIQADPTIIHINHVSLNAEVSGGFILYNRKFPYGGDIYDFMFRTGPSIVYTLTNKCQIKVGYRWMHVSNGKGYGNQNPFYEAQGISIAVISYR